MAVPKSGAPYRGKRSANPKPKFDNQASRQRVTRAASNVRSLVKQGYRLASGARMFGRTSKVYNAAVGGGAAKGKPSVDKGAKALAKQHHARRRRKLK